MLQIGTKVMSAKASHVGQSVPQHGTISSVPVAQSLCLVLVIPTRSIPHTALHNCIKSGNRLKEIKYFLCTYGKAEGRI